MKLRDELQLFFGGLLAVFGLVITLTSYSGFYKTLEKQVTEQLRPDGYENVLLEVQGSLLGAVGLNLVNKYEVHEFRTLVRTAFDALVNQGMTVSEIFAELARLDKDPPDWLLEYEESDLGGDASGDDKRAWLAQAVIGIRNINSETERLFQGVYDEEGETSGIDLAVVTNRDGVVLLEKARGENPYEVTVPSVISLADNPLLKRVISTPPVSDDGRLRSAEGYMVYPGGRLYYCSVLPFAMAGSSDGVLILGTLIDESFARKASGVTSGAMAVFLFDGNVVSSHAQGTAAHQELADYQHSAGGGIAALTLKGQHFLVSHLGLQEAGDLYFLKSTAAVRTEVLRQMGTLLALGLALMALALGVVRLLANRFTFPVAALSRAMTRVGEGKLEPLADMKASLELRQASQSYNQMIIGLRQKRVLEQFVPMATREEVEAKKGAELELGGARVIKTILFSDLRGFTSMSEKMPPDKVVAVLNVYLQEMTSVISEHGGDIYEYIGDAILAVFQDPEPGVRAAQAMQIRLEKLREDSDNEVIQGLQQGVGLHTGEVVDGNIGIQGEHMKRAVIGDTVNLAARIQDRSRDGRHTCVLFSGETRKGLSDELKVEVFGKEDFKGKAEPVEVWELLS